MGVYVSLLHSQISAIKFKMYTKLQILTLTKHYSSIIELKSGRKLELDDSNDVDSGNRGIIVTIDGVGRVDIPWKEFDKVEFSNPPSKGVSYDSFKKQKELTGTVTVANGDKHSGRIVYDLDEAYDLELLNGEIEKSEFVIHKC